jgi:hypothetical protein
MNAPQPVKNAIGAISLCIAMSAIAALLDRMTGHMSTGDFTVAIIVYGVAVMLPYKLAQRSNATRFVFVVLVAVTILSWLGGLSAPLPLFSKIASIAQIPIVAISIYWLFLVPNAAHWFGGTTGNAAQGPPTERIDPRL